MHKLSKIRVHTLTSIDEEDNLHFKLLVTVTGFRSLPMESALLRSMCELGGTEPMENCRRRGIRSQLELSETLRLRWNRFWRPILCLIWSSIGYKDKKNNNFNKRVEMRVWSEIRHEHAIDFRCQDEFVAGSTIKLRPRRKPNFLNGVSESQQIYCSTLICLEHGPRFKAHSNPDCAP